MPAAGTQALIALERGDLQEAEDITAGAHLEKEPFDALNMLGFETAVCRRAQNTTTLKYTAVF